MNAYILKVHLFNRLLDFQEINIKSLIKAVRAELQDYVEMNSKSWVFNILNEKDLNSFNSIMRI